MTILEMMERAGAADTETVIPYIEDAINLMQSNVQENLRVKKINLVKNQRKYDLPADIISLDSVSILDTEDDNKYKRIRRLSGDMNVSEDTNP